VPIIMRESGRKRQYQPTQNAGLLPAIDACQPPPEQFRGPVFQAHKLAYAASGRQTPKGRRG